MRPVVHFIYAGQRTKLN